MAQLMRMGWFRPVHVKRRPWCRMIRALLTARKLLVAKLRDVESSLRGILRGFGLKVGAVSKGKFEARHPRAVAGQAMLERWSGPCSGRERRSASNTPRCKSGSGWFHRTRPRGLDGLVRSI